MHYIIKIVLFSLFSTVAFNVMANDHQHQERVNTAPAAQQQQVINATGVVQAVDSDNNKITIHHDPIPAVGWPAMTMRFTRTSDTQFTTVKPGDKVAFSFIQQGNLSLLRDIHTRQ
ncbi:copper-binding protein [Salmonella enterica subsp. salamae]|uniref:Copper-binding protein n=1 Tax=Salmonella enterica subsp. salamae TaxID=59202 RepID=A0A5Y3UX84_SALER|nr:copper-binding protein [Salmonella enterica subsp. salamae]EDH0694435.1 cation efflux system protein CusF [Salmonella enterica]EHM1751264.1 cation efflux system protein CusF [Salmonella enterica subsp. salamae serovar 40:c:e,n,x,z15]HCM2000576.1 cation efflux system protein CusF [Salmonella enterica subsp. salamae serovar [1],40:z35:e,n,x,z15]ECG8514768.1 copper-binding protein [Salmonella enterica subsp. salamae]